MFGTLFERREARFAGSASCWKEQPHLLFGFRQEADSQLECGERYDQCEQTAGIQQSQFTARLL